MLFCWCLFLLFKSVCECKTYIIGDERNEGRIFDGIGAVSGGGATSKLLVDYPGDKRSQILDYLFLPNYGASLQILKVEIGGDDQSTDGTEASHMHYKGDENYLRGYEWWLMKEAKSRNPDIKIAALAWAFPGWIGDVANNNPYANPDDLSWYLTSWIKGARTHHGIDVDYIGIWNEKDYNVSFIVYFCDYLQRNDLGHIKVVIPDQYDLDWEISKEILKIPELRDSSKIIIGEHYPGTKSSQYSLNLQHILWSSEDYSTNSKEYGGGCWARVLNQNYVVGKMTSTIAWNLIYSYYKGLPYPYSGLMTANTPWSGEYEIDLPIWVTAHTTHFTQPGWQYLDSAVDLLSNGGSFVTLASPDRKYLSIIIESATWQNSQCVRPELPKFNVSVLQTISFKLISSFINVSTLYVWRTRLDPKDSSKWFKLGECIHPKDAVFSVDIEADYLITITNIQPNNITRITPNNKYNDFPIPYHDSFNGGPLYSEPKYLSPQVGSFEISNESDGSIVLLQSVILRPTCWCWGHISSQPFPIAFIGDHDWGSADASIDFKFPQKNGASSMFLAVRVDKGGCDTNEARGIFAKVDINGLLTLYGDYLGENVLSTTKAFKLNKKGWNTITLRVIETNRESDSLLKSSHYKNGGSVTLSANASCTLHRYDHASTSQTDLNASKDESLAVLLLQVMLNDHMLFDLKLSCQDIPNHGFVAFGTGNFGYALFQNFKISHAKKSTTPNLIKPKKTKFSLKRLKAIISFLIMILNF